MLKHNDIISQISEQEKITLLTDISRMSDEIHEKLNLPTVNVGNIEDFCTDEFPPPVAMANTWNMPLISEVANETAIRAKQSGINFVEIPGPKIKINPYRPALSEDPVLASAVSREYLNASSRQNVACGIRGFGITKDELEFLDKTPDERFLREFIAQPFSGLADETECIAVIPEKDFSDGAYGGINFSLLRQMENGKICDGKYAVYDRAADSTVNYLRHGAILIGGSPLLLDAALSNCKKLESGIEHGTATLEKLNGEIQSGKAVSPVLLDTALDRMLDFAFDVNRISKTPADTKRLDDSIKLKAVLESAVLLKNNNSRLPLKKGLKVCAIGDIVQKDGGTFINSLKIHLESKGMHFIGFSRGYDLESDRSSDFIQDAVNLARTADVVLLFLGLGAERSVRSYKTKKISIPANQQELLSKLEYERNKTVAVMPPESCIDVVIPQNCAAILYAPLGLTDSACALSMVLSGEFNPCGKLASTAYLRTDERYIKYKTYHERDKIKTGPFIGYRYYDIDGSPVQFPFGHGLGYSKFVYRNFRLSDKSVSFTIKNCGRYAGSEIAQVYIGKEDSGIIRPVKELCAFTKVQLAAGEKKTVTLSFDIPKVYDITKDAYVREYGDYTIYVGASITDIKFKGKLKGIEGDIISDGLHISDYIHSKSNISKDNFKLEAAIPIMKRSIFNLAAGAVALILALILKIYCISEKINSGFLDWFSIIIAGLGVVFFVTEAIRRNRIDAEEKRNIDKLNEENFVEAEQISGYSASRMFATEFDVFSEDVKVEAKAKESHIEDSHFAYIDKEQSFENAAREFEVFACERGLKISPDQTKKIFASIAASHLTVFNGMPEDDFEKLILVLSSYFETSPFIDRVDDTYKGSSRVIFGFDGQGNPVNKQASMAIDAAKKSPQNIHFIALSDVIPENLPVYLTPFVDYVKNPLGACFVPVVDDRNIETACYLPSNIWFILNLADGKSVDQLPDFVSEVATVGISEVSYCDLADYYTHVHPFSYYQLDYLAEKAAAKFSVDEETWKKIDRLEEYVSSHVDFKIGNKMWLCLEKFAHVFMACGGDKDTAIDEAISSKLVPSMMAALKDSLSPNDRSLSDTIEMILGEERAEACKALIGACETVALRISEAERLAAERAEVLSEESSDAEKSIETEKSADAEE